MTKKRFILERSDYDLKYEFRVADTSKVKKTKEDFWNEEEEIYEYSKYIAYLLENGAFLTLDEANELLNTLNNENEQLKQALRDYHNAFDCSQCRYQNYDWFSDGDEFEICDKGNNEAQMEYHSCKDWEEL